MKSRDYEEFIESLNRSGARYLIVGAHAVAFHARPRATKDLDVYIDPDPPNAERVLESVWSQRVDAVFGDIPAHYLALDDLIRAKTSAGREQDKADVNVLRRVAMRARRRTRS